MNSSDVFVEERSDGRSVGRLDTDLVQNHNATPKKIPKATYVQGRNVAVLVGGWLSNTRNWWIIRSSDRFCGLSSKRLISWIDWLIDPIPKSPIDWVNHSALPLIWSRIWWTSSFYFYFFVYFLYFVVFFNLYEILCRIFPSLYYHHFARESFSFFIRSFVRSFIRFFLRTHIRSSFP